MVSCRPMHRKRMRRTPPCGPCALMKVHRRSMKSSCHPRRRSRSRKRSPCSPRRRRPSPCGMKRSCYREGKITNNPFLNFLRQYRKTHCGLSIIQIAKKGAQEWRCMSDKQKSMFKTKHKMVR